MGWAELMFDRPPQLDGECQRIAERFSWQEWELWRDHGWPIPKTLRGYAEWAKAERIRNTKTEPKRAETDDQST
jgi:hypothetical protein